MSFLARRVPRVSREDRIARTTGKKRGGSGAALMAGMGAVFAIDAADSVPGEQWVLNKGTAGQVLRARYGSVGRSEIRTGVGLVLPGGANLATVPDANQFDITGDIEFVVRVQLDQWPPALNTGLVGKWTGGGNLSYGLGLLTNGTLLLYNSHDGSTNYNRNASAAMPAVPAGETRWIKATLDVDNGAGGNSARFYWAPDSDTEPTSWTQIGSDVTTGGTTSLYAGTASVEFGSAPVNTMIGVYKRAIIRRGIGGPKVIDIDFTDKATFASSFLANHEYGVKSGALRLAGHAGSYASVPDSAATSPTGDFEVVVRAMSNAWNGTFQALFNKQQSFSLFIDAGTSKIAMSMTADGSSYQTPASSVIPFVNGSTYWVKARRTKSSGLVEFFWAPDQETEPTSWTAAGTGTAHAGLNPYDNGLTTDLGAVNGGSAFNLNGAVYRGILRTDFLGTTPLDVSFAGVADDASSFVCSTGQTVTINGCARPTAYVTSANAVDTNDPLLLPWTGQNYIYYPDGPAALPTNRTTSPAVAYNTTGDVEWIVQTKGINWSSSTRRTIAASWNTGFLIDRFNATQLLVGNSNSSSNCYSLPPHGLTGVQDQWFRVRYIKSTGVWNVAKSADGVSWTDMTSSTTTPSPGVNQPNFTQPIEIGGSDDLGSIDGRVPFAEMRNGIGGPALWRYDERDITDWTNLSSWVSSTGETWTITRAVSGRKTTVVTRPLWLFGTDDYMEVADNDLLDFGAADDFSVVAVIRRFANLAVDSEIINKKDGGSAANVGWQLSTGSGTTHYFQVADGTNQSYDYAPTPTSGAMMILTSVRRGAANQIEAFDGTNSNGTSVDATGDLSNGTQTRIGRFSGAGGNYADMELLAVGIFRRALSATEIASIVAAYQDAFPPSVQSVPAISTTTPARYASISTTSGTWTGSPSSYAYQWQTASSLSGPWSNISGATSSSTLVTSASGGLIRCAVTATNVAGSTTAYTDAATVSSVVVNPMESLGAVLALDAASSVAGEQWVVNRGTGGQVLRARYGSVGRAEIRNGVGVLFPNASGNYVAIPWSSPTDMDIVVRMLNDPCYTSTPYPMGQFGSNMSWGVLRDSTQLLMVITKDSGGSNAVPVSVSRAARPDIAANAWFWARIRRVSSTGAWTIEVQPDGPMPTSWGTIYTGSPGPTGALTGSTENRLGFGGNPDLGAISYYQHAVSIGGVALYAVDFAAQADLVTSFTANHGYGVKGGALVLPGIGGSFASVPSSPSFRPTSSLSARWRVSHRTWTPSSTEFFGGVWNNSATRSWTLGLTGSKQLRGLLSTDGSTNSSDLSSSSLPVSAGDVISVRMDWSVSGTLDFYYKTSPDVASDTGWTLLNSYAATSSPLFNSSDVFRIGAHGGSSFWNGSIFRSYVRIDGSVVLDADFSGLANDTTSFAATTGQTVTLVGCDQPVITVTAANAVDTNDPLLLPWSGESYVYLPGGAGNSVNVSISANAMTSFSVAVRVSPESLASNVYLGGLDYEVGQLSLRNDGKLQIVAYDTGSINRGAVSGAAIPGLAVGTPIWLRGDFNATTGQCDFYSSTDQTNVYSNVVWTSRGSVLGSAGGTFSASVSAVFGSGNTAGYLAFNGRLFAGRIVRNSVVLSEFSTVGNGGPIPSVGAVPSLVRSSSGRKLAVVTRPIWLFGTDDFMEVSNSNLFGFGATDSFSVAIVERQFGTATNIYLATRDQVGNVPGADVGWVLYNAGATTSSLYRGDNGVTLEQPASSLKVDGDIAVVTAVRTPTSVQLWTDDSAASLTGITAGSLVNSKPLRIGRAGSTYADMEVVALALFRKALSASEIAAIVSYYGTS